MSRNKRLQRLLGSDPICKNCVNLKRKKLEKKSLKGRKLTEEHKRKLSIAQKKCGHKIDAVQREKMLAGKREKGCQPETRLKMSLSHIGKKQSQETIEKRRPILCEAWKKRRAPDHEENLARGLKRCNTCKEIKLFSSFYKSSNTKEGRMGKCKPCFDSYNKKFLNVRREPDKRRIVSQETREKIGASNRGKIVSEETRLRLSLSHAGQKSSRETIEQRSRTRRLNTELNRKEVHNCGHKVCTDCKETKSLDEFYKTKSLEIGYLGKCKKCTNKYQVEFRRQKRNREKDRD